MSSHNHTYDYIEDESLMALTNEDRHWLEKTIKDETEPLAEQIQNLWKTLKGGNGDGVVTELRLVQHALKGLEISVRSLVDRTDVNRNSLQTCQMTNIPKVQQAMEATVRLEKKVIDFINQMASQRKEDRDMLKEEAKAYGGWIWFRDKRIEPLWVAIVIYLGTELFKYVFLGP
jgi:hypothetical protein